MLPYCCTASDSFSSTMQLLFSATHPMINIQCVSLFSTKLDLFARVIHNCSSCLKLCVYFPSQTPISFTYLGKWFTFWWGIKFRKMSGFG